MTETRTWDDTNQFFTDWYAALNSRSTRAVLELVTPDILWDDQVFWPRPIHGREDLATYLDTVWKTMPDYEYYEVERFASADHRRAVVLWGQRGHGTRHSAPGTTFDFQGCDVFLRFEGTQLAHYQAAYEINDMCRQLGLIPPRQGELGAGYLMRLLHSGR